ncbi:MAG: rRNA maturation RNase YbeY [Chitinophagaceae bacterium]|nr:rRNA maturation RNase YbeY [Chitinophagaceae bacterium]
MQKIHFYSLDRKCSLKDRKKLKIFIETLVAREKKKLGSLSYIFCSDEHLLGMNKEFLQHDYYTDVITFDLGTSKNKIEAEVYISIDRVKENAKHAGVTFTEEMHRVIFHGALHLCGYKDKKSTEIDMMRQAEKKYLNLYFR